jgi:Phytanoyl-CoA dioxygenase (PhyH)
MEALSALRIHPWEDSMSLAGDPEGLRARVGRDGFLYLKGVIPPDRVCALRTLVLSHARKVSWLDPEAPVEEAHAWPGKRIGDYQKEDWTALQSLIQMSRELWDVADAPTLHKALRNAFGRTVFLFLGLNTCRVVSPHPETTTRPHQDLHYVGLADEFVTVWVPLGDCPLALGTLAVLPGSHRRGLLPHYGVGIIDGGVEIEDDVVWQSGDAHTGDAVVLTQLAIHRALPNRSGNRLRLSVDLRYGFRSEDAT